MRKIYYAIFAGALLSACNGQSSTSGNGESADSSSVEVADAKPIVKDDSPKVLKIERSENFIPVEDATEEDYEMKTTNTYFTYDDYGRIVKIKKGDEGCTITYDYSNPSEVIETTTFEGDADKYVNKYYMDGDGYVTKVKGNSGNYTFKYKDGHVVESNKDDSDGPITYEWKDGNMVSVSVPFPDDYVELTKYSYTNIPLEANFDYAVLYNLCGLEYIHIVSKGFNSKNHVSSIVNDHPIEDEFGYDKDKDGNIKEVYFNRCGDNYSQNGKIKVEIGK